MSENDYLFYTYTGNWNNNTLNYTTNYPHSIIFHPQTHRIMHNGIIYGSDEGTAYFIKGNNATTDTVGVWTGTHPGITEYKEGLSIIYIPVINGNTTGVTLNISGLGARNVYFNNNQPLTTQYSAGTPMLLTYVVEGGTGKWKRADSDTLDTPIAAIPNSGTDYYLTLTDIATGKAGNLYTVQSILKYNRTTQTLYCNNFNGAFIGNLTGNASTATKLAASVTIWGQSFDGSSNISGNISNTGNITPSATNTYYIGSTAYKYTDVYASNFHGTSEGVKSYIFGSTASEPYTTIYLLGHTDNAKGANGTGHVNVNPNLYLDQDGVLRTSKLCVNSNPSNMGTDYLYVVGNSSIKSGSFKVGTNIILTQSGNIGVGTSNPLHRLHVDNGNAYITGTTTSSSFIKINGSSDTVLVADGSVKQFTATPSVTTPLADRLVLRDSNANIYGARYYTDISNETMTPTSVYVGNSTDTGIHKMSISDFISSITENKPIVITKTLTISTAWMDTGIETDDTTFPSGKGTYIIQVDATDINNATDLYPAIYSGIMSVYYPTNNQTEVEEVLLHCAGYSTMKRLYIRTKPSLTSGGGKLKIQIAASHELSAPYSITFKFKKII